MRLYPGFDAQTANGISYGVFSEIRTGYSDAGVGENGKPIITTSSSSSTLSSLYVKRAYGYIGTPTYGYVRFGQGDSAFTLLQAGVVEAFGDGGQWTLEGGQALMFPSNSVPAGGNQFIYADQSAVYATDKVVYVSPALYGVSVVAGYEPNSNGLKEGYNNDIAASSTSANLSSSPVPGDIGKRRKNTADGGVDVIRVDGRSRNEALLHLRVRGHEALSLEAAGAHGDERLLDRPARSLRINIGVHECGETLLLVGLEDKIIGDRHERHGVEGLRAVEGDLEPFRGVHCPGESAVPADAFALLADRRRGQQGDFRAQR